MCESNWKFFNGPQTELNIMQNLQVCELFVGLYITLPLAKLVMFYFLFRGTIMVERGQGGRG
jgi:hypothetical protein